MIVLIILIVAFLATILFFNEVAGTGRPHYKEELNTHGGFLSFTGIRKLMEMYFLLIPLTLLSSKPLSNPFSFPAIASTRKLSRLAASFLRTRETTLKWLFECRTLLGYLQCRKTDGFRRGGVKVLFLGSHSASFGKKMKKFVKKFIFQLDLRRHGVTFPKNQPKLGRHLSFFIRHPPGLYGRSFLSDRRCYQLRICA